MRARAFAAGRRNSGFTYVALIVLVAIIGLVGAAGLKLGALEQRRSAEQELLDIGAAFGDALTSYASATPPGQPRQPRTLAALLRDERFPAPRRHLRNIFVDPISGVREWGLIRAPDQLGILAVYSLSNASALKIGNFDPRFQHFTGSKSVSDWKFAMAGVALPPPREAGGVATPHIAAPPGVRVQSGPQAAPDMPGAPPPMPDERVPTVPDEIEATPPQVPSMPDPNVPPGTVAPPPTSTPIPRQRSSGARSDTPQAMQQFALCDEGRSIIFSNTKHRVHRIHASNMILRFSVLLKKCIV